jgi:hypothetical protein
MKSFARQPYNIQLNAAAEIEDLLKNAGFVDVHRTCFRWDLHARTNDQQNKTFSQIVRKSLLEGLDAYSRRAFLKSESQSYEQYDASLRRVRSAIENEANRVYIPVDVVYARKPDLDDSSVRIIAGNLQTENPSKDEAYPQASMDTPAMTARNLNDNGSIRAQM